MPISNYPTGFPNGVTIRGVPITQVHPGKVFWVGNNTSLLTGEKSASDSNKGTYLDPFSTIVYAMTQVVAGRGDIIVVRPGFTCTIISAAQLVVKANTAIIGLGVGTYRATFNFTTAVGASVSFAGAGSSVTNFLFTGGIDALTGPISVSAADVVIQQCEYKDVTGQATDTILTTAAADRLLIADYTHDGAAAAGANTAIALVGGDRIEIRDCYIYGNFAVGAISVRTTAATRLWVHDSFLETVNTADLLIIDTITASTGSMGPNLRLKAFENAANITEAITGATFKYWPPIYVNNNVGEMAMLSNITAATDA